MTWIRDKLLGIRRIIFGETEMPERSTIEFAGDGVEVEDDAVNKRTLVTVLGAGGSGGLTNVTGSAPIVVTTPSTGVRQVAITAATTGAAGSMSAADKTKLDASTAAATASALAQRGSNAELAVGYLEAGLGALPTLGDVRIQELGSIYGRDESSNNAKIARAREGGILELGDGARFLLRLLSSAGVELRTSGSDTLFLRLVDTPSAVGDVGCDSNGRVTCYVSGALRTCPTTDDVTSTLASSAFIQGGNSFGTTATIGTGDSNPLVAIIGGTEAMRLNTSRNLGLGTNSPGARFHASSGAGATTPIAIIENTVGAFHTFVCSGSPEGAITASPGYKAVDVTNGREYLKATGTGNTGWVRVATESDIGAVRAFKWNKPIVDAAASTAWHVNLDAADRNYTVLGIMVIPDANLTVNDTNYKRIRFFSHDGAGSTPVLLASCTTTDSVGTNPTGSWTQDAFFSFAASGSIVTGEFVQMIIDTNSTSGIVLPTFTAFLVCAPA